MSRAGKPLSSPAGPCHDAPMADSQVEDTGTDFAVAAYREEGRWVAAPLPVRAADSLPTLVHALRQQPGEAGAIGLVSVAEDFFVAVRVLGEEERLLLSDVTAAQDWPIAREVLDHLDLPMPEGEDLDEVQPAGDLGIFEDLGLPAMEVAALCEDLDLFPDEVLGSIAGRLGFGVEFEQAVEQDVG